MCCTEMHTRTTSKRNTYTHVSTRSSPTGPPQGYVSRHYNERGLRPPVFRRAVVMTRVSCCASSALVSPRSVPRNKTHIHMHTYTYTLSHTHTDALPSLRLHPPLSPAVWNSRKEGNLPPGPSGTSWGPNRSEWDPLQWINLKEGPSFSGAGLPGVHQTEMSVHGVGGQGQGQKKNWKGPSLHGSVHQTPGLCSRVSN